MTVNFHRWLVMVALALCCAVSVYAQDNSLDAATERRLKDYFLNYKLDAATGYAQARMKSYRIDNRQRIVTITANDAFAAQNFTAKMVSKIYRKVSRILPSPYDTYKIRILISLPAAGIVSMHPIGRYLVA